jgi:hypothetical protein
MTTQIPNVVHPKRFRINGMFFTVIAFISLTDSQAAKIAQQFYAMHKFKKSDQGKEFRVVTLYDEDSVALL